jgi:Tfp pilus assembly protein PilO
MQQHRIISLASILAMLLIPVMGWFLVAQPQFAAAANADTQRADLDAQNAVATTQVEQLQADSAKLVGLNNDMDELRQSIPFDADASNYIDGLTAIAATSGVVITGLTVGDASPYAAAVSATAPVAPAPTEGDAAATAPVVPVDPAIVTSDLITSQTFVVIPVTIDVSADWSNILQFVQGLQSGSRLFLVTGLNSSRDETTNALTASIAGFIYAIPGGLEGHPHPVSSIVKQLNAPVPVVTDDPEGDGATPTPNPTATTAP